MSAFDFAWAIVKMPMYYHATPTENLDPILREGIRSNFGEVYASLDPEIARRWISFTNRQSPHVSVIPFWRDEGDPRMTPGADHSPMMLAMLGFDPNEVSQQASWVSNEPIPPQDIWPDSMENERSPGILTYENPMFDENYAQMMEQIRQMNQQHMESQDEDDGIEKYDESSYSLVGSPLSAKFPNQHQWALFDTSLPKPFEVGRFAIDLPRPQLPTQFNRFLEARLGVDGGLRPYQKNEPHTIAYSLFTEPHTNQPIPLVHANIDDGYQGQGLYSERVLPALIEHYGTLGSLNEARSYAADSAHKRLMENLGAFVNRESTPQGMNVQETNRFVNIPGMMDAYEKWDLNVPPEKQAQLMEWTQRYDPMHRIGSIDTYTLSDKPMAREHLSQLLEQRHFSPEPMHPKDVLSLF